jgi:folate-binding protein YgfZ
VGADEYRAAREGAGFFDLPDRAVIAVSGPLRQKFLHNILSNDVQSRAAGQGTRAAVMGVKGHLLAFLRVLVDKDEILLEVAGGRAAAVEGLLVHYRVAAPVRFRRPDDAVVGIVGARAADILRDAGLAVPDLAPESHAIATAGGVDVRVARAGDLPAGGFVLHVPAAARETLVASLAGAGAVPLTPTVVDVLRIEDGRPWFGPDVSEENLLHETTLVREYHSPTKGCYVGQEVIARLEARGGNVNKLLRGLRLGAAGAAGDLILAGGKEVGRITSAGVSPELGPIAMGYVHRSAAEPGTAVEVGSSPATVARLPVRPSDVPVAQEKRA